MKEERKRILDMVQDGKITAQEAIILLEALEKDASPSQDKDVEKSAKPVESVEREKEAPHDKQKEKDVEKDNDDLFSQFAAAGEKIFDFISSTIGKVKDFDLGQAERVSNVFQHADTEISIIEIDVANGNVKLKPWDQKDVRVECEAKMYRIDQKEEARNVFLDKTNFSVENGKLHFSTKAKWMRVNSVIYIPKAVYDHASVRIFNGSLQGDNLHAKELKVKTVSGDVSCEHLNGDYVEIETANGNITLDHSTVKQIAAETLNGNIMVNGTFKSADLQSFNGNITCNLLEGETEVLRTKAVTGNIKFKLPATLAINGELKTNLGSFKTKLEGIDVIEEKSEMVQKQFRFKREGEAGASMYLTAETKTGSIIVE